MASLITDTSLVIILIVEIFEIVPVKLRIQNDMTGENFLSIHTFFIPSLFCVDRNYTILSMRKTMLESTFIDVPVMSYCTLKYIIVS